MFEFIMKEKIALNLLLGTFLLAIVVVLIVYIVNFKDADISSNPADWGVLGDYIGGLLNPLISALTLFFVARTYINQREEIKRAQESANKADSLRQQATDAQVSLAESYLRQIEISNKSSVINMLNAKISAGHKAIEIYYQEISRVSESISSSGYTSRRVLTMNGKTLLSTQSKELYISEVSALIAAENDKIQSYIQIIDELA